MVYNKTVKNPLLLGCIQLMREEDSADHRNMFYEELMKSEFIAPASVTPDPDIDPVSKFMTLDPNSRIQFPLLLNTEGKRFLMAFTDEAEYRKWVERNAELPRFVLTLDDYAKMMFSPDSQGVETDAVGLVINPLGCNMVIPKNMLAGILAGRYPEIRQYIVQQIKKEQDK